MKTFIEKCISNTAHINQIDDYIDMWHKSDSDQTLHDYLGMSFIEYDYWMDNADNLEKIINNRKKLD